jgi:hypothetical protein
LKRRSFGGEAEGKQRPETKAGGRRRRNQSHIRETLVVKLGGGAVGRGPGAPPQPRVAVGRWAGPERRSFRGEEEGKQRLETKAGGRRRRNQSHVRETLVVKSGGGALGRGHRLNRGWQSAGGRGWRGEASEERRRGSRGRRPRREEGGGGTGHTLERLVVKSDF